MKKLFVAAVVLMTALAANAQTPQEVAAKYNEAGAKYTAKDYAAAITMFEEAIVMGEAAGEGAAETVSLAKGILPKVYLSYAGSLANAKKFDEALVYLDKTIASGDATSAERAKSMTGQVYNVLGASAWNAQDFAKSAEYFGKAHELAPSNVKVATQLAESYGKLKEYDKSYALFEELIAKGGAEADALKSRLAFYMLLNANEIRTSDAPKALELLTKAVDLEENPQAYLLLLQTASGAGNYARVVEFAERAAAAQADAAQKSNVYSMLGHAYEKMGSKDKAIEAYRKVTSGPNAAAAKAQVAALQAQ